MKIGNHEIKHNEGRTAFTPIYDLDGVCQDCVYLEKIRPLFDKKDKEIERLNNIINELEKLELYEFEPDYDYEENLVEHYTPFDIKEYIQKLKGDSSNE